MELIGVLAMIVVGGVLAIVTLVVIGVAQRSTGPAEQAGNAPDRSRLAASILYQLLLLGGLRADEAMRDIRRQAGLASPVTAGIDIANWGGRFAQLATREQREWLLETAVQLVAAGGKPLPLRQYTALLDLSFSLGFQTDALARLRELRIRLYRPREGREAA